MQGSINFDGSLVGNITGGGGGGGSDVVITPVVTSGTKIADVSVNGVEKDLYCPTPPTPPQIDITPVQESGTKIADVSLNGVEKDLYAPNPTIVNVTQVQQSGTKIATIGVNGQNTDIYAPEGGSDVEVTQVVSSGTKIATITVDNTPTDLYAPEGGGDIERSSTEKKVGIGYNGKPIYQRTFKLQFTFQDGSNDIWSYYRGLYNVKVVLMNYKNSEFPNVERCNNLVASKGGVYITYQTNNGALRIGIDTGFNVIDLEFTLEYQKTSDS